jgi:hypothetical protein
LARIGVAALVAASACATPAHAAGVGELVNRFMRSMIESANEPAPEPAGDRRAMPDSAVAGVMSPPRGVLVDIDGRRLRLSPGCQIRDLHNRIVPPARVRASTPVRYVLDQRGQVHRVWLMMDS